MYDLRYPTYKSVKSASDTDKAHLASRAESSPQKTPKASAPSFVIPSISVACMISISYSFKAGVGHSTNQGKTILSFGM